MKEAVLSIGLKIYENKTFQHSKKSVGHQHANFSYYSVLFGTNFYLAYIGECLTEEIHCIFKDLLSLLEPKKIRDFPKVNIIIVSLKTSLIALYQHYSKTLC